MLELAKPEGITFEYGTVMSAEALYAKVPRHHFPIGFIWYTQDLVDIANIGYIWVHETKRRQGLATLMLTELRRWYPKNSIATTVGNDLSTPWLKAVGFRREQDGWFIRPNNPFKTPFMLGSGEGI